MPFWSLVTGSGGSSGKVSGGVIDEVEKLYAGPVAVTKATVRVSAESREFMVAFLF